MKRILIVVATVGTLTLGGVSAASASFDTNSIFDQDCDGYNDITGERNRRANGVCGG